MHAIKTLLASLLLSGLVLAGAWAGERVDINTADAQALARVLTNVGPAKAEEIVRHREEHGPFRSAEELAQVRGIGLRTVELNQDRIDVGVSGPRRVPAAAAATAAAGQQR